MQQKDGKAFQHEGIVHAANRDLAFVLAKEAFTRRFLCTSLFVADTRHVYVSPTTEGNTSAMDQLAEVINQPGTIEAYDIFVLPKRGKQHVHVGQVQAVLPQEAMWKAKQLNLHQGKVVYNVWAIRTADIRFTTEEEKDLWLTLPEKKFRDASDYKGGDKLKEFLERSKTT